jgi:hypothetical protein
MGVNHISGRRPPPPPHPIVRYLYTKLEEIGVGWGGGDDLKGNLFGPKKASKAGHKITNALVVKMLLEIIIFMRGNPKLGPFEGVGNENLDF